MSTMFFLTDAREFVKIWFEKNNMTAREATRRPALLGTIWLDYGRIFSAAYLERKANERFKKFSSQDLEYALEEYILAYLEKNMEVALSPFSCLTEDLSETRKWVRAVTGSEDYRDIAVIAHWIWLIKRNGSNKEIKHQIMPVLYGPQGSGKSKAIDSLIKPLKEYRLTIGMDQLSNDKVFSGLSTNFVVFFDELQGVERTDMNALKRQITTTTNTYRKMYSHVLVSSPMRCSFIGATNKPIVESLNDSTGMRRFWQINSASKVDWHSINSIDYSALWTGIDENKEDGYLIGDLLTEVLQAQQKLVSKEDIDDFLEENVIKPETEEIAEVSSTDLYASYVLWAGDNGINKKLSKKWFSIKLNERLESEERRAKNRSRIKYYKINKNCAIDIRREPS